MLSSLKIINNLGRWGDAQSTHMGTEVKPLLGELIHTVDDLTKDLSGADSKA